MLKSAGKCYQECLRILIEGKQGLLVHGSIHSHFFTPTGGRIDHAWIELPTGLVVQDSSGRKETLPSEAVYDPSTFQKKMRLVPKDQWYELTGAGVFRKYTAREAWACVKFFKTSGPWHEQLMAMVESRIKNNGGRNHGMEE